MPAEILGLNCFLHNIYFSNHFFQAIRQAIKENRLSEFKITLDDDH